MSNQLALLFTFIYVVCFAVGALIIYSHIVGHYDEQTKSQLENSHAQLNDVYQEGGIDEVLVMLSRTESDDPEHFGVGYKLVNSNGTVIFNSFKDFETKHGFYNVKTELLGLDTENPDFSFYTTSLGGHTLSIGRNNSLVDDLKHASKIGFLIIFLLTLLLAISGTTFMARSTNSRIIQLARAMEEVGKGNLKSRLPISHRNDNIDKLSNEMNTALTLLQKNIRGMEQFGFNIAHDLKTPMNRLYIRLEETMNTLTEDDPVFPQVEAASTEAAHINSMFVTLLRIAQIESGSVGSGLKPVDLGNLLQNAYEVFDVVADDKLQNITLNRSKTDVQIHGAPDLLLQMIANLIENSITHCPPGANICITAETGISKAILSVCDNGPGIPAHETDAVFDSLYRLETSRTTPGSGLGLTMVKAIAEIHNASIKMTDNSPGLCVTIEFQQDPH